MAATPNVTRRTDITLKTLAMLLDELIEGVEAWEARSEDECVDFILDWEKMVQRVVDLTDPRYADEVTGTHRQHLAAMARRLQEAREVIPRLGLDYPELGHLSLAS